MSSRTDLVVAAEQDGPRLGHIGTGWHIAVYVLLAAMITVDYILLSQALTLLLRNDSQYGSIGLQMFMITAGISLAVVTLPHVVAILLRRIESRITPVVWWVGVIVLSIVWLCLLAGITVARIKAGIDAQSTGALSGLAGANTGTATTGFSWTAPDTIMAFLMLGVLLTSGAVAFVVAWLTTRPLLSAVEKGQRRANRAALRRDLLSSETIRARETTQQMQLEDAADAERYVAAQVRFRAEVDEVRSMVGTMIAAQQKDPAGTSQIIRELRRRREGAAAAAVPTEAEPA